MDAKRVTLHIHDEPIDPDKKAALPRIGARGLVVRDDNGRELDVEFLAWGQLGLMIARDFPGVETEGEAHLEDEVIVRSAKLDAGADYLLILVRCDHAIRD
jgi:hypothetical protein